MKRYEALQSKVFRKQVLGRLAQTKHEFERRWRLCLRVVFQKVSNSKA